MVSFRITKADSAKLRGGEGRRPGRRLQRDLRAGRELKKTSKELINKKMRTQVTHSLFLVFSLFVLSACEQRESRTAEEREQQSNDITVAYSMLPPENRATLLAIKYGIPKESIDQIVSDYLSTHDTTYRFVLYSMAQNQGSAPSDFNYLPDESVIETVERLSSETGVEPEKIASVIVDYEMWSEASAAGDY